MSRWGISGFAITVLATERGVNRRDSRSARWQHPNLTEVVAAAAAG